VGSETIDVIVVVGLDKERRLIKMAKSVGGDVYLDEPGNVMKGLGGKGVPHWWVLNSDNKILKHISGYTPSVNGQIKALGL
jgi:hypothetical protein